MNAIPQVIHMPLEELLDSDLAFDDPDSAGENPTAYVCKPLADQMAEALQASMTAWEQRNSYAASKGLFPPWFEKQSEALAAYREAKG